MIVTFFGHRDSRESLRPALRETVKNILEQHPGAVFYVGSEGGFDGLVTSVLKEISSDYPTMKCYKILAYLPKEKGADFPPTLYPEGLETVPKRFAICRRNEWMLAKADLVVTHAVSPAGNATKMKALAERKGKTVINLI